ncbi:OmpA family protein [Sphingomonas parva]|nr:OmpA family protein [Sphingomonas parva]
MADDVNPIETMTPGQILAEASVADFIKALGLSIADAQKALDVNSISQIGEYAEKREGLDNKSLLQLGLSPPFYHYQHADLSVSMQLTMKVGKASAFGIGAKVDFGLGGGTSGSAKAREAQVTLKKLPASVTVDGTKTDAAGADLEAAGEALAVKLRSPTGKFERAYVNSTHKSVAAELDPASAKNPILTPGAVAFLPTAASSSGIIRIIETPAPNQKETFVLAADKSTEVSSEANKLLYARKVVTQINALGGFKAKLSRDPGGSSNAPDAPGALGIALFDTGSSVIKKAALEELELVARLIQAGNLNVDITGYADTRDTEKNNKDLGQNRANAVAKQLRAFKVTDAQIKSVTSGGETHWNDAPQNTDNAQFRRAEITLAGSTDLFIIVDSDTSQLQATPLPDKTSSGEGNGFILVRAFTAQAVDATKLKIGDPLTAIDIKPDAVNNGTDNFAAGSPQAFAFNLAKAINDGSDTHKARATRRGSVVLLARADDVVTIDLLTLSSDDIKLSAADGASVTKPLAAITPAGPTASKDKPNVTLAVGVAVDYRTSRQFEQSVNGNSSITARLVAVPAPVEFLDEIKKFLEPTPTPAPSPTPTPTPSPAPTP